MKKKNFIVESPSSKEDLYFFEIFDFSQMSTLLLPLCPSTSPHLCRTIAAISIAIAVAIHSITSTCKADCCREQSLALSFVLVAARCCHLAFSVFLALSCYCPLIIALPWLKAIAS